MATDPRELEAVPEEPANNIQDITGDDGVDLKQEIGNPQHDQDVAEQYLI